MLMSLTKEKIGIVSNDYERIGFSMELLNMLR